MAIVLFGCAPELPAPREQDVIDALAQDFMAPMGDVLFASRPGDCRTDGVTDAPVAAGLFAAFLDANEEPIAADAHRPGLRIDSTGDSPRMLSARTGEPVVAFSRAGLLGDDALVCIEVFGAQERAFFVLLARDHRGVWSVRSELEVWTELPPEELPGGELVE